MFGYIKPHKEELLIKDYNIYRAVYCGLCRHIKKNVSFFLPFSLSYDFVFLAISRDIIAGEKPSVTKGRCPYNPLKKRSFISSRGIEFASLAALLLVEKNIEDKRRDKDMPFLSPFLALADIYLKKKIKKFSKDEAFSTLCCDTERELQLFSELERERAGIDELAEAFGKVMATVISSGLSGDKKRIAESLGRSIGAWLYIADAIDDFESDCKKGHFNPLLKLEGTHNISKERARELDITLAMHAKNAHLALSLLESSVYTRIGENIVTKGMGLEAFRLFTGGKNDRSLQGARCQHQCK